MNLPGKYPFKIRSYETDESNHLKISSVFNFMQVAAGLNAEELGFGYTQLNPRGIFWILSRVILEWHGNVRFDEDLIVETWPNGIERLFAIRDFRFYSQDGANIGKATTAWLMMDAKSGRPVNPANERFDLPLFKLPPAIDELPGKITEPAEMLPLASRSAVYSDIDVNQHVNNAKYLEYIFDALPASIYPIKNCRLQINYLKELKLGDTISIMGSHNGNPGHEILVSAINQTSQKIFQSRISFLPIS
jgi:medium-chain acyl-[acyl-carrier-protein] hydrolase